MTQYQSGDSIGGRYKILEQLGAGGMGQVFLAHDRLTRKDVALKCVRSEVAAARVQEGMTPDLTDTAVLMGLTNEFRILASLQHPNIIRVIDYGIDDNAAPYYVMELVKDGILVSDYARDKPPKRKYDLIMQMLQALVYLHRRRVLHRDLKPQNVLVTDGQIKIVDFGLWAKTGEQDSGGGTVAYLARELLTGESDTPDESSDLYAVGVMCYELLCGKHPFNIDDRNKLIHDVLFTMPDMDYCDVPEPVAKIIEWLMQKSPELRPQTAAQVIALFNDALAPPTPYEIEPLTTRESFLQAATFVGRQHEYNQLETRLLQATDRRGSACMVAGESGVGKSRLLDELRTRALVEGVMVLNAQAVKEDGLYTLWREPLRRLLILCHIDDVDAAILKPIVPDIETLLERSLPPVPELDPKQSFERLIGVMSGLFRQATQPILLIVEDLHWGRNSLPILAQLLPLTETQPLMIVGSTRTDEPTNPLEFLPTIDVIELSRLNPAQVAELSRSMLGDGGDDLGLVTLLVEQTEGNAFFLVEVVRALSDRAGGELRKILQTDLPRRVIAGGIERIVEERLERVPAFARHLLNVAAFIGRSLDLALLKHIQPDADLEDWLTACVNAAVVDVQSGEWRFAHDKLREGIISTLPDAESQPINRQIAEAIVSLHGDAPEYSPAITRHWSLAGDRERERHYAQVAGEWMLKNGSSQIALEYLQRALLLISSTDSAKRAELSYLIGQAYEAVSDFEEAMVAYTAVRDLAAPDTAMHANGLRGMGRVHILQTRYDEARQLLEQSLPIYRAAKDRFGEVATINNLVTIRRLVNDVHDIEATIEQNIATCQSIDFPTGEVVALNNLVAVLYAKNQYQRALTYIERSLALSRRIGRRSSESVSLESLGVIHHSIGALDDAVEYFSQALAVSRTMGNKYKEASQLANLGIVYAKKGEYSLADATLRNAQEIFDSTDTDHYRALVRSYFGTTRLLEKKYDASIEYLNNAFAIAQRVDNQELIAQIRTDMARCYLHMGDLSHALATIELAASENSSEEIYYILVVKGIIHSKLNQPEQATKAFEHAIQEAQRHQESVPMDLVLAWYSLGVAYLGYAVNAENSAIEYHDLSKEAFKKAQQISNGRGMIAQFVDLLEEIVPLDDSGRTKTVIAALSTNSTS